MSWRVTLACDRAEAEALPESEDFPPCRVAAGDRRRRARPGKARRVAHPRLFADQPLPATWTPCAASPPGATAEVEQLGEDDWVTMSQAGLEPIRAGRFFVHTPTHREAIPEARGSRSTPGSPSAPAITQTTAGCLAALDRCMSRARSSPISPTSAPAPVFSPSPRFRYGRRQKGSRPTSTRSRSTSPSTMPRSITSPSVTAKANTARGRRRHGPPLIAARAPFDLLIANILAGPLIDLAPAFAASVAPGATVVLAGLLDTQAEAVIAAYEARGMTVVDAVQANGACWC